MNLKKMVVAQSLDTLLKNMMSTMINGKDATRYLSKTLVSGIYDA